MPAGETDRLLQIVEADRLLRAADLWCGGSSLTSMLVLARLRQLGGSASFGDLRRASGHQKSAFTSLVNRLVADGAVERTVDEHDRRSARLSLTDSGRKTLYDFRKMVHTMPADLPDRSRGRR